MAGGRLFVTCKCGRQFKMPERFSGRNVRCSGCGNIFAIPRADQADGFVAPQAGPAPADSHEPPVVGAAHGTGPYFICPNPNCGFRGKSLVERQGSILVFVVLLLFFWLPGLIYGMFCRGRKYFCPGCRMLLDTDRGPLIDKKDDVVIGGVILAFLILIVVLRLIPA